MPTERDPALKRNTCRRGEGVLREGSAGLELSSQHQWICHCPAGALCQSVKQARSQASSQRRTPKGSAALKGLGGAEERGPR